MGRLSRSWDLVTASFTVLWQDKQLLMFPVLSGISCVVVTLLLVAGGAAIFLPQLGNLSALFPRGNPDAVVRSPEAMAAVFALYLANYFVIIFSTSHSSAWRTAGSPEKTGHSIGVSSWRGSGNG